MLPDLDVATVPRDELPALLGKLVELEARVRLRLAEAPPTSAPSESRLLTADQAAAIAGVSRRVILQKTRGLRCRRDLSRKLSRFDEGRLRAWLAEQRPSR